MIKTKNIPRDKDGLVKAIKPDIPLKEVGFNWYKTAYEIASKKVDRGRTFWQKLKRTILAKNKVGKIIAHVLTASVSLLTGFNISPLLNLFQKPQIQTITQNTHTMFTFNWLTLILLIAGIGLGYVAKHFKEKVLLHSVLTDLQDLVGTLKNAKDKSSDEGQKISQTEWHNIITEAEAKGFVLLKQIWRKIFGNGQESEIRNQ